MKKNIDDKKLEKMLRNIYKSEPSHTFQYNSSYVPEKNTETAGNYEYTVSGTEHIRRNFSISKFISIAAVCTIAVTSGAVYLGNHISMNSHSAPAAQSDIPEEKSLFDKYLEEFEYETGNFDYECIKVTANAEPDSYEESQNYIYGQLCRDMNIVPAYENCGFLDSDGSTQSLALPDEDFFFYIKKIYVPVSENETTQFYTRQSYLVWKDENGNITKIRPSAEKVTADDIENKLDCSYHDIRDSVENILNNFSDENTEVYIDDTLVRPAVPEENRIGEPKVSVLYNYYAYININGQLTPVNSETVVYNSESVMEFDDSYKATENIPFFYGEINDRTVSIRKTFFWNCSDIEPADISSYIAELNDNYWLETAEVSLEYITEPSETDSSINDSFCFSDLVSMDNETADKFIDKYGDALQRTENGYTLCSYCLEQNGFDLADIKIYPDADFSMDILTFYDSADTQEKLYSGICYDIPGLGNHEAIVNPFENYQKAGYHYENYKVQIQNEDMLLTVYFPNPSVSCSDEEKEMNEKFHNRPWAEIIIEK